MKMIQLQKHNNDELTKIILQKKKYEKTNEKKIFTGIYKIYTKS